MSVIQTREIAPHVVRVGAPRPGGRPMPGDARQQDSGLSGRDILRILRKRKWLIIISLVLCIGLSIGATMLWLMYAPYYTATARLEVQQVKESGVKAERGIYTKDYLEVMTAKFTRITSGEAVFDEALTSPSVRATSWFQQSPQDTMLRLRQTLTIAPEPGTAMIRISATGTNRAELPDLVNAVASAAVRYSIEQDNSNIQFAIAKLIKVQENITDQRDRLRTERRALIREAEVPDFTARVTVKDAELKQLGPQISALELELAQADAQLQLVRAQVERGEAEQMPTVLQALEMDPSLRGLTTAVLNMRSRMPAIKAKWGENHPRYKEYEANIKSMEEEAKIKRAELTKITVQSIVANTEANKAIILDRLVALRDRYRLAEAVVRQAQATLSAYDELREKEDELLDRGRQVSERLLDLQTLLDEEGPLKILQLASTPLEPSWPKWPIMVALGVVLGLVIGLGTSFLLEMVDTSIKGPSDVLRRLDLPLLGMVPHEDDVEEQIDDFRKTFLTHPNSLVSEAFRQIRTGLQFSGPANQRRSLLVTSPQPEDGRTTVAMNLAASIARSGKKVLVVDANFRQPAVRELCTGCPDGGLSSALVGQGAWRDMVLEIEPNFSVMASGPMPPNPGELLGSDQMRTILAEMTGEYDQVIIDGAPCLVVTDSVALGSLVDGIILVVRAGANTYGIVQRTQQVLARGGTHIVGIVLNGVRAVAGGYLRKNYEAFYDYHDQIKLLDK